MLIWAGIRQQSDSNRTQLLGSQDRPFDRFVPRIRSSAELIAMNSRMPDQDNLQERLKTAQDECQRLREENAQLRAMLGINQSSPHDAVPASRTRPKAFVHYEKRSLHARGENLALSRSVSWARRCFRHSVGRKEWQIWLFTCQHYGLACHPCRETRRAKDGCPQNQNAPATDG